MYASRVSNLTIFTAHGRCLGGRCSAGLPNWAKRALAWFSIWPVLLSMLLSLRRAIENKDEWQSDAEAAATALFAHVMDGGVLDLELAPPAEPPSPSARRGLRPPQAAVDLRAHGSNAVCPICCGAVHNPTALECGHEMCRGCARGYLQRGFTTCPYCRQRTKMSCYGAHLVPRFMTQSLAQLIPYINTHRGADGDWRLLHLAAMAGRYDVLAHLCAELHIPLLLKDAKGRTVLHAAIAHRRLDLVYRLLHGEHDEGVPSGQRVHWQAVWALAEKVFSPGLRAGSPLLAAAARLDQPLLEALLGDKDLPHYCDRKLLEQAIDAAAPGQHAQGCVLWLRIRLRESGFCVSCQREGGVTSDVHHHLVSRRMAFSWFARSAPAAIGLLCVLLLLEAQRRQLATASPHRAAQHRVWHRHVATPPPISSTPPISTSAGRRGAASYVLDAATLPPEDLPSGSRIDEPLHLTFATASVDELLSNWVAHMHRLRLPFVVAAMDSWVLDRCSSLRAVCLPSVAPEQDRAMSAEAAKLGAAAQAVNIRGNPTLFNALGGRKVAAILLLLERSGRSVLISDVDVVWRADPYWLVGGQLAGYEDFAHADVLASSDCIDPEKDRQDHGCFHELLDRNTGVLLVRNTKRARSMMAEWGVRTAGAAAGWETDQTAFDDLIRGRGRGHRRNMTDAQRAEYLAMKKRWCRMPSDISEAAAMGEVAELGSRSSPGSRRIFKICIPNVAHELLFGLLPVPLVANGHSFYVQQLQVRTSCISPCASPAPPLHPPLRLPCISPAPTPAPPLQLQSGIWPLAVHATYQFGDEADCAFGKRERMREWGLWLADDAEAGGGAGCGGGSPRARG